MAAFLLPLTKRKSATTSLLSIRPSPFVSPIVFDLTNMQAAAAKAARMTVANNTDASFFILFSVDFSFLPGGFSAYFSLYYIYLKNGIAI